MTEHRRGRSSGTELFLNEYDRHFSLITDPDALTQSVLCTQCLHFFYQTAKQQLLPVYRIC